MDEAIHKESKFPQKVRLLIAFYLLVAVLLKAFFPAESAIMVAGYGVPSWLMLIIPQIELALAFAVALNLSPKATYPIGLGLFTLFGLFSLHRAISGAESCGCFGALTVNPWLTFVLDLFVVGIFIVTWPRSNPKRSGVAVWILPLYITVALTLGIQISSSSIFKPFDRKAGSGITVMNDLIILEPEKWIGNPLPIADSLLSNHDLSRLKEGSWTLLFHHHDCPKCLAVRTNYISLSKTQANVLFVEVPPFGNGKPVDIRQCLSSHLSPLKDWFMQAPVEVRLKEGVVISASLDLPSIGSPLVY